ncbi:hypothetical protein BO83DRAFT_362840 [Aspergillus eucalypticola CBS 122712]|uniref:Uncharacterized protein n=1 Tax=Aspergillus eucalypticola (strain CBS 122712 / IBT 29274) TaxID=1448314 RepID=A0A317VEP2_ASPEC|nr:uncharacterized protein BO83DRAFT_362840 [Aspergillus eucalypticola CBS 122712]PWY71418.1 hypothetical protein BO83DRAFT_362840 [Aspergillus eucalypticola CBS 122712]
MEALIQARQEQYGSTSVPLYGTTTSATSPTLTTPSSSSAVSPQATSAGVIRSSSSSTPTSTSSSLPSHSNGVSKGALAGAIVGSIAGTALLAIIGAALFFRRKKGTSHSSSSGDSDRDGVELVKPRARVQALSSHSPLSPTGGRNSLLDLIPFIPQPADDQTVSTRIQTLFDHIGLHIDNYYVPARHETVSPTPEEAIRIESYASTSITGSLITALASRRARRPVLNHVLARTIIQAIQPRGSLYPPFMESHGVEPLSASTSTRDMFAWRMLTARLHPEYVDLSSAAAQRNIAALAENFSEAFAIYQDPELSDADRRRHLASVVREAAQLSVWLFTQPCSFNFSWSAPSPGSVVVLPAVIKISDERGDILPVPQKMVEETIAQI